MGFQEFVTERLADLTAKYNALVINAKKIFELPVQSTLDPTSLIHVSRAGTSESLEIQKIIDAIVERNYSQLLSVGEIAVSGLTLTIPAGATWVYNGVYYATAATTNIPETLCEAGYLRKDILVANQSNQIVLVKGDESLTIRIRPNIPVGTVLVTELDVDDTVIGTPTTPVIGEGSISKREKQPFQVYQSGEINNTVLDEFYYGYLNFRDAVTNLKSIGTYSNAFLYSGKEILIKNSQATDITISHLAAVDGFVFSFPNELDFVLKPNEIIRFSMKIVSPTEGVLEYVGIINSVESVNIADVTGLTEELADRYTKAEVDSKVSSVYKFKGNVANYAALPVTSLTIGDVYNLSDTGVNYAWTGTVWDELGTTVDVSGKENTSNKTDTIAGNEASSSLYASIKGIVDWFTSAKIKSILGITTLSGDNTGDQDLSGLQSKGYLVKHFKSYFTAITGYTAAGFTPTYSDGRMIFTGGSNDFTKYITIDGLKNTDENIEIEVIYKVTTIGATGYGLGIGKRSFNGWYWR